MLPLCAATVLTGCAGVAGSAQYAQVRFIEISPDAPSIDLYQNSTAVLYNVGAGTATSYIPVAPGTYTWAIHTAGLRQQLASASASVTAGAQYTVLIGDTTASLQMSVLKDQAAPALPGQAAIRVLHQATRAGAVDLYLVAPGGKLSGAAPIATNVSFGNAPVYLSVPSGTYSLIAVPAGGPSAVPVYSGSQSEFTSGSVYTVILYDPNEGDGAVLHALTTEDVIPAA